ncbi:tetratricopeptide repeat protein [Flavobacterium sp.]|uniref:tetratricopeptide repeat protein n=1 Tax=Flavobacterium sp. TaxID=239 RepID=UPI003C3A78C0
MKYIVIFLFPYLLLAQSSFEKAQMLFDNQKYEQAQSVYEALLKTNPNNLKIIERLGDIAGGQKDWDKALMYYSKLRDLKASVANYHYKYGGALGMKALGVNKFKALGMISDIKKSFEKAIELDEKHIEARWALVELYLRLPSFVGGSEAKALKYSNELLMISPVDGYLSRGRVEEYFERYKTAEVYYKKAISEGGSKIAYQKLANLYKNKMENPEKAKLILEEYENKKSVN